MEHYETIWINEIGKDVEITITYHYENDGIGSYEFWGTPGFDKGTDYPVVDEVDFDRFDLTAEECHIVNNWIDSNIDKIKENVREKYTSEF